MSTQLYIFTESEAIVTSDELRSQLRAQGWDAHFFLDQGKRALVPAPEGPLRAVLDVVGWPASSPDAGRAADVIGRSDLEQLDGLYAKRVVGSCGYAVEHPYVFQPGLEDEFDEDEEDEEPPPELEPWCLEALERARTKYWLRVRMGSNNLSYQLLELVSQAIGKLRDGMLENPHSGEFRSAKDLA